MAVVSGYTINHDQYLQFVEKAKADEKSDDEYNYRISIWPDGSVTIDNGDSILIEFSPNGRYT